MNPRESFNGLQELKEWHDQEDKFLISEIDPNQQYSKMRIRLATYVDVQSPHYLKKEFSFFDGKHGRVNEFITLAASIYYPLLKSHIILATIDCKHEDTNYVERFWHIFKKNSTPRIGVGT